MNERSHAELVELYQKRFSRIRKVRSMLRIIFVVFLCVVGFHGISRLVGFDVPNAIAIAGHGIRLSTLVGLVFGLWLAHSSR